MFRKKNLLNRNWGGGIIQGDNKSDFSYTLVELHPAMTNVTKNNNITQHHSQFPLNSLNTKQDIRRSSNYCSVNLTGNTKKSLFTTYNCQSASFDSHKMHSAQKTRQHVRPHIKCAASLIKGACQSRLCQMKQIFLSSLTTDKNQGSVRKECAIKK